MVRDSTDLARVRSAVPAHDGAGISVFSHPLLIAKNAAMAAPMIGTNLAEKRAGAGKSGLG